MKANPNIIIHPGDYDGAYYFQSDYTQPQHGEQKMPITPGTTTFVSVYGTGTEGMTIAFATDKNGDIDPKSITPSGAAKVKGGKLEFQTARITVDPVNFSGGYILAGHYCEVTIKKQSFVFVKNLRCYIELYSCGGNQEVFFALTATGEIIPGTISNPSAVGTDKSCNKLCIHAQNFSITTNFPGTFRIGNTFFSRRKAKERAADSFFMVNNYETSIQIVESDLAFIKPGNGAMRPPSVTIADVNGTKWKFDFFPVGRRKGK